MRDLDRDAALALPAGADHYRAFVGPPERYGPVSLNQLCLLQEWGLQETDCVLDMGCGSLRLGRLLIPFLLPGGYFGVEPNAWLIEAGLERELGRSALDIKRPTFGHAEDFNCAAFGDGRFDFIMMQSIITHTGWRQTQTLLHSAARALKPDGLLLFSILREYSETLPEPAWTYPGCVAYPRAWLLDAAASAGLLAVELDYWHPGARWLAAAPRPERIERGLEAGRAAGEPRARWRSPLSSATI